MTTPRPPRDPEERANGTAESTADGAGRSSGGRAIWKQAADETKVAAADSFDEVSYDNYVVSGANPFSSMHPQGTGLFPRLLPREFPQDEEPPDLPVMEQLPDPGALPGYPDMHQAFPSAAAAPRPCRLTRTMRRALPMRPRRCPARPGSGRMCGRRRKRRRRRRCRRRPPLPHVSGASSEFPAQAPRTSLISAAPSTPWAPGTPWASGAPGASDAAGLAAGLAQEPHAASVARSSPAFPASPATQGPSTPPVRETADSLTADLLLHGKRRRPARAGAHRIPGNRRRGPGWRVLGEPEAARPGEPGENPSRRRAPPSRRMSLKGGVGKTTTAVGLGATLGVPAR